MDFVVVVAVAGLSRKFGSASNFGPRTEIFEKYSPGGPLFLEKIGPSRGILVQPESACVNEVIKASVAM